MRRIIDLSFPLLTSDPRGTMRTEVYRTLADHGANITLVSFDTHFGTHLDAPSHQLAGAPTLDQVDLVKCVGPATVLDLTDSRPGPWIDRADLEIYAEAIAPGTRILLRTDWSERVGSPDFNQGYPALTVAAASWLAKRGVLLLGIDTPSVAPVYQGRAVVNAVHQPLLSAEVVLVENLCHLREVPNGPVTFAALPLNLVGLDGCPVRAIAIVDG